jgi:hypothetical protein
LLLTIENIFSMRKVKRIIQILFCKHNYIWLDHWIDEQVDGLIVDEYYCSKCDKIKYKYTFGDKDLTNYDL